MEELEQLRALRQLSGSLVQALQNVSNDLEKINQISAGE